MNSRPRLNKTAIFEVAKQEPWLEVHGCSPSPLSPLKNLYIVLDSVQTYIIALGYFKRIEPPEENAF